MGGGLVWTGGAPPAPISGAGNDSQAYLSYPGPAKDGTPGWSRFLISRSFPGGPPEIQRWADSFHDIACTTPQLRQIVAIALWYGDTYQVVFDKKDLPINITATPQPGLIFLPSTGPSNLGVDATPTTGPVTWMSAADYLKAKQAGTTTTVAPPTGQQQ